MPTLFWSREMANVSYSEPVLASRRERRAGCPGRRYQKREGDRERRNGGRAVLDNAILVAMKRGLYVFFRDLKASSGH